MADFGVYICGFEELPSELQKSNYLPNNNPRKEWAHYIVIKSRGKIVEVYSDSMAPEDANFCRNLSWIPKAILDAYGLGLMEGKGGGQNR